MKTVKEPALQQIIADTLHQVSANQLPAVCERFGLATGTREEAFNSKRLYVLERVNRFPRDKLMDIARDISREYPRYELLEAVEAHQDASKKPISSLTRQALLQALCKIDMSGNIPFQDFISELWPLDEMPSTLYAGKTIRDDMIRHMVANPDWSDEDLFKALGLQTCSYSRLFALLEAVVHPRTRNQDNQQAIIDQLNPVLRRDGYALLPAGRISGYPVYTVEEVAAVIDGPADASISAALAAFNEDGVAMAWGKALDRRVSDPEGAITAARTLLETVCKHIIEKSGGQYGNGDDLPKLYHLAASSLNLAPDQHLEKVFKAILGSCQSIVGSLGALRNQLSDAHGKGRKPARPLSRHAELAVNLAGSMATFLVATWLARPKPSENPPS
jgi:hypothetical protein